MFIRGGFRITPSTTSACESVEPCRLDWGSSFGASVCCLHAAVRSQLRALEQGVVEPVKGSSQACGIVSGVTYCSSAIFASSASSTFNSIRSSEPSPGRAGSVNGPSRPTSSSGSGGGESTLSSSSSPCSGDSERGNIGVWPAWSLFAAGSGDMTACVGGGEGGTSSSRPGVGSEIRATRCGRFLRSSILGDVFGSTVCVFDSFGVGSLTCGTGGFLSCSSGGVALWSWSMGGTWLGCFARPAIVVCSTLR